MDIKKVLLAKYFRELLTITGCLSHSNNLKPWISKKKRSELSINSPYVKGLSAKLGLYTRWGPASIMKTPCVIYFLNLKLELLQQVETGRNSIVHDIGWSICKAVHFGESKQSLELQSYEDLLKTGI